MNLYLYSYEDMIINRNLLIVYEMSLQILQNNLFCCERC